MTDKQIFFNGVRAILKKHGQKLTPKRVKAIEFLVDSFDKDQIWSDLRHIAYAFATIMHETAFTFEPITEYGGEKYFTKYDVGRLAKRLGNTPEADGDGFLYRGRGYVQITGKDNYLEFGIADDPDKALVPEMAFRIMTIGMHEGTFTGHKLNDYIQGIDCDYKGARKIINGRDKAALIAGYAKDFERVIKDFQAAVRETMATEWATTPITITAPDYSPITISPTPPQSISDTVPSPDPVNPQPPQGKPAVSSGSIFAALTVGAIGAVTWAMNLLVGNPIILVTAALLIIVALGYWSKAKDRATARHLSQ